MKVLIKAAVILLLGAVSCSKEYVEEYSTIYRTDKDGNKVCRLFTEYNVNAATASHAMVIYYSGNWTVEFTEDVDWAYLDRNSGSGVTYIHVGVLQNDSGAERTAVIRLTCDNGETADISITQASNPLD